ncbi:hypothetical protein B0H17DRAFT_1137260 [Mycena rosella]|uniref:Dienelactone hydrolase domain-containing protein n=1 Tax=Mycena rosella TaxID=1033263 RepID=A0AAD7D922_MYCRO|nr:hypothetical protein B0H17DRAFT_1137260 [Mycena rosella]
METIGGIECYVPALPHERLCSSRSADDFARNGFKTVAPDYLHGDAVPEDLMTNPGTFDGGKWFAAPDTAGTRPLLDSVLAAFKADGVTSFGATGSCFGGRYVFDLAFDGVIAAAATSHPSLLQVPADLEKYAATAKAPFLINSCTTDGQFPLEAQAKTDEILTGFAPGDPKVKAGKEGEFKSTVEWMFKHM